MAKRLLLTRSMGRQAAPSCRIGPGAPIVAARDGNGVAVVAAIGREGAVRLFVEGANNRWETVETGLVGTALELVPDPQGGLRLFVIHQKLLGTVHRADDGTVSPPFVGPVSAGPGVMVNVRAEAVNGQLWLRMAWSLSGGDGPYLVFGGLWTGNLALPLLLDGRAVDDPEALGWGRRPDGSVALFALISPQLLIKPCKKYARVWTDRGSGAQEDGSIWRPLPAPGYFVCGDRMRRAHADPGMLGETTPTIAAVEDPRPGVPPMLAAPTSGARIWDDEGSGAHQDGSIWAPLRPYYLAMGHLGSGKHSYPDMSAVRMLRADVAAVAYLQGGDKKPNGDHGWRIWWDRGSGADADVSAHAVHDGDNKDFGTFVAQANYLQPQPTSVGLPPKNPPRRSVLIAWAVGSFTVLAAPEDGFVGWGLSVATRTQGASALLFGAEDGLAVFDQETREVSLCPGAARPVLLRTKVAAQGKIDIFMIDEDARGTLVRRSSNGWIAPRRVPPNARVASGALLERAGPGNAGVVVTRPNGMVQRWLFDQGAWVSANLKRDRDRGFAYTGYRVNLELRTKSGAPDLEGSLTLSAAAPCRVDVGKRTLLLLPNAWLTVKPDARGQIAVRVQAVGLRATNLRVRADFIPADTHLEIDPSAPLWRRLEGVSGDELRGATDADGQPVFLKDAKYTAEITDKAAAGLQTLASTLRATGGALPKWLEVRDSAMGVVHVTTPLPEQLPSDAVALVGAKFIGGWIGDALDAIEDAAEDIGEAIEDGINEAVEAINDAVNAIGDVIGDIVEAALDIADTVYSAIETAIDHVVNIVEMIGGYITRFIEFLAWLFSGKDIQRTKKFLSRMLDVCTDRLLDDMPGAVSSALDRFSGFLGGLGGSIGLVENLPGIPTEVKKGVGYLLDAVTDNPVLDALIDLVGELFDTELEAPLPPELARFDAMLAGFESAADSAAGDSAGSHVDEHTGALVGSLGASATPITALVSYAGDHPDFLVSALRRQLDADVEIPFLEEVFDFLGFLGDVDLSFNMRDAALWMLAFAGTAFAKIVTGDAPVSAETLEQLDAWMSSGKHRDPAGVLSFGDDDGPGRAWGGEPPPSAVGAALLPLAGAAQLLLGFLEAIDDATESDWLIKGGLYTLTLLEHVLTTPWLVEADAPAPGCDSGDAVRNLKWVLSPVPTLMQVAINIKNKGSGGSKTSSKAKTGIHVVWGAAALGMGIAAHVKDPGEGSVVEDFIDPLPSLLKFLRHAGGKGKAALAVIDVAVGSAKMGVSFARS